MLEIGARDGFHGDQGNPPKLGLPSGLQQGM
jgi:hypothetical protein